MIKKWNPICTYAAAEVPKFRKLHYHQSHQFFFRIITINKLLKNSPKLNYCILLSTNNTLFIITEGHKLNGCVWNKTVVQNDNFYFVSFLVHLQCIVGKKRVHFCDEILFTLRGSENGVIIGTRVIRTDAAFHFQ
ncbi:Protein of unknown function [Gryllus bimaculatus]|nr:Protein of unknown function [Gryllus bimaculatus]